jgi:hypothetical protein
MELKYTVHAKKIMAKQDVKGMFTNIWYIEVSVNIIEIGGTYNVTTSSEKKEQENALRGRVSF